MPFPSFNSLRTFETAARLRSFNLAAKELCVSPSAISHQIRQLESILGVKLFIRTDRKVMLSPKGELYYPRVHEGINMLVNSTNELMELKQDKVIKISAVPFFATRWLMPRLERFQLTYPEWELSIKTSTKKSDFSSENFDLVIRRGGGDWPDLKSVLLKQEYLTPVCSPTLARKVVDISTLKLAPLLHNSEVLSEWSDWFSSINEPFEMSSVLLDFQNTSQILEACIAGAGVALIDPSLIVEELISERLVRPIDSIAPSIRSYYLAYPISYDDREAVQTFSKWINQELSGDVTQN